MTEHLLNRLTRSRKATMSSTVLVAGVPSSAYHLLASFKPQDAIVYPFFEARSHRIRSSIMRSNIRGDRGSPYRVPLLIPTEGVWPYGVKNYVAASLYKFETMQVKSWGRPKKSCARTNWLWSVKRKAPLKSR